MSRSILIRGAAFAALSLVASAACADEQAAPVRAGLKVHMDPATGTILEEAPAAAEGKGSDAPQLPVREKADYNRMTTRTNAHGAVLLNVNGQIRMYSVATVKPSGEIEETCITGNELARREAEQAEGKR